MLTFQILDGGEVLTFTLEDRPITIGTDPTCDVRLRCDGVAPVHARVEPFARDGEVQWKLVDLGSEGGTRRNGERVAQVALSVGDRIEIGDAALILGKRVLRQATARDVLDEGLRPRVRRRAAAPSGRPWLPIALGAAGGLTTLAWLLGVFDGAPGGLRAAPELIARGEWDQATRTLESLRAWAGADRARLAQIEPVAAELSRALALVARLEAEARVDAAEMSPGEQIQALKARAERSTDAGERAAIRTVLSRLADLRLAAPPSTRARHDATEASSPSGGAEVARARPVERESTPPPDARASTAAAGASAAPNTPSGDGFARAQAAFASGHLRDAARALDGADATDPKVADLRAAIATRADELAAEWVKTGEELVALGFSGDAAAMLRQRAGELPPEQGDAMAARAAELAAIAIPSVAPAPPPVATDPLRTLLRGVESAEAAFAAGAFAEARSLFVDTAEKVAGRDAKFAAELRTRAEDCALLTGLHTAVADRLVKGGKPEVTFADGHRARLVDCTSTGLRFSGDGGEEVVAWPDLPPTAVDTILRGLDAPADAYLGAAVLALTHGDPGSAEARLVSAARKDAGAKGRTDAMLARVRGESVPPGGYKIEGGGVVAATAATPLAREIESRLENALRQRDAKAREAVLADLLARGPEHLDAVVSVLRRVQATLANKLQSHPLKKNWDKVGAERDRLDAARAHALELIFDEVKYFYPYKPPAVSADQAKLYAAVQREVDVRVKAVRDVWEDSKVKVPIPATVAVEVEKLRWVSTVLDGFGERSDGVLARVRWAQSLPAEPTLTVQNFCRDPLELEAWHLARRVEALNKARLAALSPAEREQLEVTNAYRRQMGRRPLVVDMRILAAARGHCDEMERLGYFGHFSPTPGLRSPYERMRAANYAHGSSENIASNGSATGAHDAWLHSSGHHRNILGPLHTEFACGQRGRLWTQNFGAGRDFERELPE